MGKSWLKKHPYSIIGKNVIFNKNSYIGGNRIEIKNNTVFKGFLSTRGNALITIGKYCYIGKNLFIIASYKPIDLDYFKGKVVIPKPKIDGPVYIGNNVNIGDDVIILPGVSIGDRAVIEHKSVVMSDVKDFSVYAGNPAKFIRYCVNQKATEENMVKETTKINMNNNQSSNFLLEGWCYRETGGRWVISKKAGFVFITDTDRTSSTLYLHGYSYRQPQKIKIYINNKESGIFSINNSLRTYKIKIFNLKKGINKFQLNFEQFFRPIDIHKKSGDKRQLYCFFQKIFLE